MQIKNEVPGKDEIVIEALKPGGSDLMNRLQKLFNLWLQNATREC